MLIAIDLLYKRYQESDGTVVVKLDKALYGCVEASLLWYNDLMSKLTDYRWLHREPLRPMCVQQDREER